MALDTIRSRGTAHRHGPTVGYVVAMHGYGYVGTVCHGYNDPSQSMLLGGIPATLFKTRAAAQRVIDSSAAETDTPRNRYSIIRVAPLA